MRLHAEVCITNNADDEYACMTPDAYNVYVTGAAAALDEQVEQFVFDTMSCCCHARVVHRVGNVAVVRACA
jgi:ribosomal protein L18